MKQNKRIEIMDIAENLMRSGGYNGFSFRDIAKLTGIKSASVHYHFPSKDDLCVAVIERYQSRFVSSLGDPSTFAGQPATVVLRKLRSSFRAELEPDGVMCLGGLFASQTASLPERVSDATVSFFNHLTKWLNLAFSYSVNGNTITDEERQTIALTLISRIQGAILLARLHGDINLFDRATQRLI